MGVTSFLGFLNFTKGDGGVVSGFCIVIGSCVCLAASIMIMFLFSIWFKLSLGVGSSMFSLNLVSFFSSFLLIFISFAIPLSICMSSVSCGLLPGLASMVGLVLCRSDVSLSVVPLLIISFVAALIMLPSCPVKRPFGRFIICCVVVSDICPFLPIIGVIGVVLGGCTPSSFSIWFFTFMACCPGAPVVLVFMNVVLPSICLIFGVCMVVSPLLAALVVILCLNSFVG